MLTSFVTSLAASAAIAGTFANGVNADQHEPRMVRERSKILPRAAASTAVTGLDTAGNVMIQLFEWPWKSVEAECPLLAKAGYSHVQLSSPNEHIYGESWATSYQPVSYKLESKRGSAAELKSMVAACNKAGIAVAMDVILNHASSQISRIGSDGYGVGFAGSKYKKYDYPGIYGNADFHTCRKTITNYQNANEVQTCELLNLSDLDQSRAYVRQILTAFLQSLVDIGVVGFRIDAAKHIESQYLKAIMDGLSKKVFLVQETNGGEGDPVELRPSTYAKIGKVNEFNFMRQAKRMFTQDHIAYLVNPLPLGEKWGLLPSGSANVFVANHDTEREGTSLTAKSPNNAYKLANIFMLANPYAFPTVYSGFDWTSTGQGADQESNGKLKQVQCGQNRWRCEHRKPEMKNMALFRKKSAGKAISNFMQGTTDQVAFGRGNAAFVAINNQASAWKTTFKSGLAAGNYCNVIVSDDPASCSSPVVVKADGTFTATVPSYDAVALIKL